MITDHPFFHSIVNQVWNGKVLEPPFRELGHAWAEISLNPRGKRISFRGRPVPSREEYLWVVCQGAKNSSHQVKSIEWPTTKFNASLHGFVLLWMDCSQNPCCLISELDRVCSSALLCMWLFTLLDILSTWHDEANTTSQTGVQLTTTRRSWDLDVPRHQMIGVLNYCLFICLLHFLIKERCTFSIHKLPGSVSAFIWSERALLPISTQFWNFCIVYSFIDLHRSCNSDL